MVHILELVGGGGGFLMLLVNPKKSISESFKNFTVVSFKFEYNGSQIIYYQDNA